MAAKMGSVMRRFWDGRRPHLRDLAYMEELGSYNGTTLSLGLDPTSPSPGQRVITQEAAGMEKLWTSYEKAMGRPQTTLERRDLANMEDLSVWRTYGKS